MASTNWKKLDKQAITSAGYSAHFDEQKRLTKKHANEHITSELTHSNACFGYPWEEAKKRLFERIEEVDSLLPPQRVKKDRVIAVMMCAPCPAVLQNRSLEFFEWLFDEAKAWFGSENVIASFVHRDEVHEYIDAMTKEKRLSLEHAHMLVVPFVPGKGVNGKNFMTRESLSAWQNHLAHVVPERFGCQWATNEERSCENVDDLKRKSASLSHFREFERVLT